MHTTYLKFLQNLRVKILDNQFILIYVSILSTWQLTKQTKVNLILQLWWQVIQLSGLVFCNPFSIFSFSVYFTTSWLFSSCFTSSLHDPSSHITIYYQSLRQRHATSQILGCYNNNSALVVFHVFKKQNFFPFVYPLIPPPQ